jgi:hypothetical protein
LRPQGAVVSCGGLLGISSRSNFALTLLNVGESVSRVVDEESGEGAIYAQPPGAARRVLAVFEPGRAGEATLREAAELAEAGSDLSVVTLAPQARSSRCCGKGGTGPYNIAVREEAASELRQARDILGATARRANFTVLVGHPSPPLAAWAGEHAFDLILLPSHPFTRGGNRYARVMRRATPAEVRLVV